MSALKTLVTGGIRSGKSAYAEDLLAAVSDVTYVATGPQPGADDAEWRARVAAHQLRRPESWTTAETADLARVVGDATGPLLIDSVGSWLSAWLDKRDAWSSRDFEDALSADIDLLARSIGAAAYDVVVVTNEVGLALVSEHRSGRIFTDWLGIANQRIAAACDRVVLVVAGCPLAIKSTPG